MPILGDPPPNALTVAFLDSGQGDCTLIISPKGQLILVDCGSIKNSSAVLPGVVEALKRYLPAAKNTIHTLVLTHPDQAGIPSNCGDSVMADLVLHPLLP